MAIPASINLQTFEAFRQEVIKACTIYPLEPESLEFEAQFTNLVQNILGDKIFTDTIAQAEKDTTGMGEKDKRNARLLYLLDAVWAYISQHPEQELSPGQLSALLVPAYERHKAEIEAAEKSADTKIKLDNIIKLAQKAHIANTQEFAEQLTAAILHPDGNISETVLSTQESLDLQAGAYIAEVMNNKNHTPQKKARLIQEFLVENHAPQIQATPAADSVVGNQTDISQPYTPKLAIRLLNESLATTAANTSPQSRPISAVHPIEDIVDAFAPLVPFSLQPAVVETYNAYKASSSSTSDQSLGVATIANALDIEEDIKFSLLQRAQANAEREDATPPLITQKTAEEITDAIANTVATGAEIDASAPEVAKIILNEGGKTSQEASEIAQKIVQGVNAQANPTISDEKITDFLSQSPSSQPVTPDPILIEKLEIATTNEPIPQTKTAAAIQILASAYGIEQAVEIANKIDFASNPPTASLETLLTNYQPNIAPQISPLISDPQEAKILVDQIKKASSFDEAVSAINQTLAQKGIADNQSHIATKLVDSVNTVFNQSGSNQQAETAILGQPFGIDVSKQVVEIRPLVASAIEAGQIANILASGKSIHENLVTHFSQTLSPQDAQQAATVVELHTAELPKSASTAQLIQAITQAPATKIEVLPSTTPAAIPSILQHIDSEQKNWGVNSVQLDAIKTRYIAALSTSQPINQITPQLNQIPGLTETQTSAILSSIEKTKSQIAQSFVPQNLEQVVAPITSNPSLNLTDPQQQAVNKIVTGNLILGSMDTLRQDLGQIPNLPSEKIAQIVTSVSEGTKNQVLPTNIKTNLVLESLDGAKAEFKTSEAQSDAIKKIVASNIGTNSSLSELRKDLNQVSGLKSDQVDKIINHIDQAKATVAGVSHPQVTEVFAKIDAQKTSLGLTDAQVDAIKTSAAGTILTNKPLTSFQKEISQIPGLDNQKIAASVNLVTETTKAFQTPSAHLVSVSTLASADRSLLATSTAAISQHLDLSPQLTKQVSSIIADSKFSTDQKIAQVATSLNISKSQAQELISNTQLHLTSGQKSIPSVVAVVASRNGIDISAQDRSQIANLLTNPTSTSKAQIQTIVSKYTTTPDPVVSHLHSATQTVLSPISFSKKDAGKINEAVNLARRSSPTDLTAQKDLVAKEISRLKGLSTEGSQVLADKIITTLPLQTKLTRQRISGFVQQAAFPDRQALSLQSIKKLSSEQRLTFVFQNELKNTGITSAQAKTLAQNSSELKLLLNSQMSSQDRNNITMDFFRRNGIDITKINTRSQNIVSSVVPRLAKNDLTPLNISNLLQNYSTMSPVSQRAVQNLFQGKNFDLALQQLLGKDIAFAFQKEGLHLAVPAIAAAAYQTDLRVLGNNTTQTYHFKNSLDMALSYLQEKSPVGSSLNQQITQLRNQLPQLNTNGLQQLLNFKNPLESPKVLMDTFTGKARGFFNFVTNPKATLTNSRWFETARLAFSQRDLRIVPETLLKNFGDFSKRFRLLAPGSSIRQRLIVSGQNSRVFKAAYARIGRSRVAKAVSASLGKTAAGRAIKAIASRALARILGTAAAGSAIGPAGTAIAAAIGTVIEVGRALWNPIKKAAKYIGAAILGMAGGSTMTIGSAVGATAGFAVGGPAGAAVGAGIGGATGGAVQVATNTTSGVLQSIGSGTGAAIGAMTTFTVTNAGTPLAIGALATPAIIAFFVFIINAGGYVVPVSPYAVTSTGDLSNIIGGEILPDDPTGNTPRCWPIAQSDAPKVFISQGPPGSTTCTGTCSHVLYNEQAIDLAVANSIPVYATHNGTVTTRDQGTKEYGKSILLTGTSGVSTIYAHLFAFAVPNGAKVGRGTLIAYTDDTGNSTGPHLHYEIIPNTLRINSYVPPYTIGSHPSGCFANTQGGTAITGLKSFVARGPIRASNGTSNVLIPAPSQINTPNTTCSWSSGAAAVVNANYFRDVNGTNVPVGYAGSNNDIRNYGCGNSCATRTLTINQNLTATVTDSTSTTQITSAIAAISGLRLGAVASATTRTARTIAGVVGNEIVLAVVDAATNDELTTFAGTIGLNQGNALELDGGGSSTFCRNGQSLIGNTRSIPVNIGLQTATIQVQP